VNSLSQLAAVFAIAGGVGLCTYSRGLDPPFSASNPATMMSRVGSSEHAEAAMAGGWGPAFITLGSLGLAVPWINYYIKHQSAHIPSSSN
jgi:hypothetical protein